jgi:histone H3/H4
MARANLTNSNRKTSVEKTVDKTIEKDKKGKQKAKRVVRTFPKHVLRAVLKQIAPKFTLNRNSTGTVNCLLMHVLGSIAKKCKAIVNHDNKQTLSAEAVKRATRMTIPRSSEEENDLQKHAISDIQKALAIYETTLKTPAVSAEKPKPKQKQIKQK